MIPNQNFIIGDRVRCIDNSGTYLILNEVYEVKDITYTDVAKQLNIRVLLNDWLHHSRFRLEVDILI